MADSLWMTDLQLPTVTAKEAGLCMLFLWLAQSFIRRLYIAHFGPLARARLPGPYLVRWTSLPFLVAMLSGRGMYFLDHMVAKYGNMVRVAPDEVAIGDPQIARSILAVGSGFLKAPFYDRLVDERLPFWRHPSRYIRCVIPHRLADTLGIPPGRLANFGLLSTNNLQFHGSRRRLYSQPFSKQGILRWETLLKGKTNQWIEAMRAESLQTGRAGKVDIFKWLGLMASDTISELCFGKSLGGLALGTPGPYMKDLQMTMKVAGSMAYLPRLGAVIANLPIPPLRKVLGTGYRLRIVGRNMVANYSNTRKQGLGPLQGAGTIFEKAMETVQEDRITEGNAVLSGKLVEESNSFELREIEARLLLVAGTDTTTVTLTFILWALARHPPVLNRILMELSEHKIDATDIGSLSLVKLRDLPYLNAVIQEGLRLYGAGSGNLPRSVPRGGKTLGGYVLPEGTVVNPQAYTLHRIERIFPDAEAFKPERWLHPTPEMQHAFLAWSYGARICLGMHLAKDEMLLSIVAFAGAFPNASVPAETTEASMRMEHYFGVAPKAHRCLIDLGIKA